MILLVGPSASGKTEAAKMLAERYGIKKAVTHTTRPPRTGEQQDIDYHFVSEEEFLRLEKEEAFVETTCYNGRHYGCSKKEIGPAKAVVVDPNGLKSFLALNDPRIVTFYLEASDETRKKRMEGRGDSPELIKSRLENDLVSFAPEAVPETEYRIQTDRRPLVDIVSEIYERYLVSLKERGLAVPAL